MSSSLGRLITDLGERSTYDAASQCSRCGYCETACPTYAATGRESRSGRGRNQLVRMLIEGKTQGSESLKEALTTCLLCGACTSACYARVPTPDIVLEGRRLMGASPRWVERLLSFIVRRPRLLARLLKASFIAKRLGLSRLAAASGLLDLLGLRWLAVADAELLETPSEFLCETLARRPVPEKPAWFYLAACGPNYIHPRVGLATTRALDRLAGPGAWLESPCCGLVCFNYGDLETSREMAREVIAVWKYQASKVPGGMDLPVVVDCSSCAAHLKSYPQLLLSDPQWAEPARALAGRVRDAVELLADHAAAIPSSGDGPRVTWHESCRCRHGQGIVEAPRKVLAAVAGSRFVEMPESDSCCGGAGAFGFSHPDLSDALLRRKIGDAASVQAGRVAASATSCLIQLAHGLKKYYPEAEVRHVSELVAEALDRQPRTP
ncbi:MAG: (Fe-S)-binding protein [Elusimicrobia bacterium]|nr:(Fe-S)-binding protein [Elusimicrobiota bacterium]